MENEFIERRILIGMITSGDYLREIRRIWRPDLVSGTTRKIGEWCLEYQSHYDRPPGREIETIYTHRSRNLSRAEVTDLGEVLESLSDEWDRDPPDLKPLLDETRDHLRRQNLLALTDRVGELVTGDNTHLGEAEGLVTGYSPPFIDRVPPLDPFSGIGSVRKAFRSRSEPLIRFGRALGELWDEQFIRGGFVALLAAEKTGKSWALLEIGFRATIGGHNVAFFQAGDMTEGEQLARIYTRVSGRPVRRRRQTDDPSDPSSGGWIWKPEIDCLLNQTGRCDREEREPNEEEEALPEKELSRGIEGDAVATVLREAYVRNPNWSPCRNCHHRKPSVWLRKVPLPPPLDERAAFRSALRWSRRHRGAFRLSTHINETLSVQEIDGLLEEWEKEDGFVADVVIIDYADLLAPESDTTRMDHRHQINKSWQRLRALSEKRNALIVTATQAAASSYDRKGPLRLKDFSEDKRKYAHVTAMYGLKQTSDEKRLGILRINPMVVREGDFDSSRSVHVIQCLPIGRAILGSF